jgi:hypothetical protein
MLAHWIDQLIERFQTIRNGLLDDEERFSDDGILADSFVQAWEQRARLEAGVADRRPESSETSAIPSASESMMGLFLGSKMARMMGPTKEKKSDSMSYDRRKLK